jgi:hypothetical protein
MSGGRLRNTWVICLAVGDNMSKDVLIPHTILREESSNAL